MDKFNELLALLSSSPTFIIASSIIFATVCLLKILNPGALARLFNVTSSHRTLVVGRAKPLNPKEWKEFPLEKKVQVSPNTAMYAFHPFLFKSLFILF